MSQATAGALACGLLSLIVSRGSSMFMESIEELKSLTGRWESAICLVAGLVSGLLLGLDGFMWKESVAVNRIAASSVPWFLLVLVCILRWLYLYPDWGHPPAFQHHHRQPLWRRAFYQWAGNLHKGRQ